MTDTQLTLPATLTEQDEAAAIRAAAFLKHRSGASLAVAALLDHVDPAQLIPGTTPQWKDEE